MRHKSGPSFLVMEIILENSIDIFPDSSTGKEFACNAGDPGSIPESGRSLRGGHGNPLQYSRASQVAQTVENLLAMRETWVRLWLGKIPLRRTWQPTPVFLPGESPQTRGAWRAHSPWVCKESDTTE